VSEKTRSYLLVVKQTLLNTVPKAIVFHQVKQAEEHLLSGLQARFCLALVPNAQSAVSVTL
jgi:Dynamin GTPase effector domain